MIERRVRQAGVQRAFKMSIICRANRWRWFPVRPVTRSPSTTTSLIGVDRAHVAGVADEVVVHDERSPAHQLGTVATTRVRGR